MSKIKFYTSGFPDYEYQVVKITNINKLAKREYKSAIIDIGIYDLVMKYKDKPFPVDRINKTFEILDNEIDERWLVATGDYPQLTEEFQIKTNYDNVKETLINWRRFSKAKNWKQGIYTLQATSISSFDKIIKSYMEYPETLNGEIIPHIGIGSTCRLISGSNKEKDLVHRIYRWVRNKYPSSKIHVWGASIHHLESLFKYCDSFDNTKWTKPHNSKLPRGACKNKIERKLYFESYLNRINTYTANVGDLNRFFTTSTKYY